MFEEFTSSTCPPCATFNTNVFTPFAAAHNDEMSYVKYQMYWPSPGDPYYTPEGGVRQEYYGVSGVPNLFTDGMQTSTTSAGVNNAFSNSLDSPAFMDLSVYHAIDGDSVFVNLDIIPHISGELVAYIIVFENITTGNVGNNGETEFHHVMMKMIPDAYGTIVTLTDGETTSISGNADMSTTFVEEMDDLGVVVFVQEVSSKIIFQSAYSQESFVGLPDINMKNEVMVFPNPSDGQIRFSETIEKADVSVFNIYGQEISRINSFSGNMIDLRDLPVGNYILRIEGSNMRQVQAISIVK
jgi:hypothetical protein